MSKPFSLTRHERLKSKKEIDTLFLHGKAFFIYPYKIIYATTPKRNVPLWFGVSVPKKRFKKAHDRNFIKRLIRESYRLQKAELLQHLQASQIHLNVMFVYQQDNIPDFELILKKTKEALIQIIKKTGSITEPV